MELEINVKGIKEVTKMLDDARRKQIPFATTLALTRTAIRARLNVQGKMKQVFDRPTRFTLSSVLYERATKKKQSSRVYLADIDRKNVSKTADYMRVQSEGGEREHTGIEGYLTTTSGRKTKFYTKALPTWIMPAKGVKLDRYGNLPRGEYNRIISGLKLSDEQGFSANITAGSKKRNRRRATYFRTKHGVMKRTGKRTVKPVLYFAKKKPIYKQRLDFHEVVRVTHQRHFIPNFKIALVQAIRSAKR